MGQSLQSLDFAGLFDGYTSPEHYEAPEFDKELLGHLEEWFQDAYQSRLPYERDWELFRLYLKGEQFIVRSRDTGEIVRLSTEDSKRLRSTNNVLRPTARSLVGKLSRSIPTCTTVPATADFEEQHGARVADAFFAYIRRKEDLDLKYLDLNNKLPWAGNAFAQLVWDRDAGQTIAYCSVCFFFDAQPSMITQPCPRCLAQKQEEQMAQAMETERLKNDAVSLDPQIQEEDLAEIVPLPGIQPELQQAGPLPLEAQVPLLLEGKEGDIKVYIRDPRNVFIDPGSEDIRTCPRFCFREVVPVATARQRFPKFAQIIQPDHELYVNRTGELRYNSVDSYGAVEYLQDHCYIYEYHEAPTPAHQNGRVIFQVNKLIVEEQESVYFKLFGRLPFFHFGFDKNDGEFWREPFLAQSWHRQKEINSTETQKREHIELLLKPKFFKPLGSRIAADEMTATSAQVISYNAAAGKPHFETPPPVPRDLWTRGQELASDIRQQAAITLQEAGMQTGDTSGRAMAIVEAEADQQVGPIISRNNSEWRELHKAMLIMVQKLYHPERKFTIAGSDGLQTFSFDELNLSAGFDVQVELEDGLSRNPAVRMTQALDLLNAGVFTNPQTGIPDIKAFMRHAKLKMPQSGYDIEATERARASQVPYLMERGQQHIPQVEDDPLIFAEEILGWLRGPGRRADPAFTQQVRMIWQFYAAWALQGAPPGALGAPQGQPGQSNQAGPGRGGPDMSAPGGTPNSPGHAPASPAKVRGPSNIVQEARQKVSQADKRGETAARGQQKHEG